MICQENCLFCFVFQSFQLNPIDSQWINWYTEILLRSTHTERLSESIKYLLNSVNQLNSSIVLTHSILPLNSIDYSIVHWNCQLKILLERQLIRNSFFFTKNSFLLLLSMKWCDVMWCDVYWMYMSIDWFDLFDKQRKPNDHQVKWMNRNENS